MVVKSPQHSRKAGKTASKTVPEKKSQKLSRQRKPPEMSLEQWQTQLRRQYGREQDFRLKNLGDHPIFSEFNITNPKSDTTYRVVIRGQHPGDNFCTCPDFATNTLGTCKHIEFTLAKLELVKGGVAALEKGFTPAYSEIVLSYGAKRQVRFLAGTECPVELSALAAEYFETDRVLRPEAFAKFETFLSEAGKYEHDLRCYEDALAFIAEVRDAENRRRRIDEAFSNGIRSDIFDKLLKTSLYDYQREGALFTARAGRCLIGDEMGLGKTIQAIAGAEIMAKLLGVERVLIICPTSLKHQWEHEIAKFSGRSTCVINGPQPARKGFFASDTFFKITNYDTVHRDLEIIGAWSPDLVILDEAQRIKNWNTRTARSVKRITSPYAIVLTGTPLENRLEELASIIDFVDRHRLGPTFRFLANHQILEEQTGRVIGYRDLETINKTLEPVLIRRQKDQVLKQLPDRLDQNIFIRMTPEQMQFHDENREIVARIVYKWRRYHFLSEADQRRLMIALQNMRMSCNSTYLLDQSTDFGGKSDEAMTLLEELFERPDTKVVIFSQWQRTHELLQLRLEKRKLGHVLFNGSVPGHKRKELVERFRNDEKCRVFLSTDAGGVGLNLQHASVVMNMDLPWNPAVLEQRIGRVHRMGQSQPVQVINFVAKGTIEESMLSLLKFKKSLFAGVLDGGENEVFLGGSRLTRFMETVDQTTGTIPASVPEEPADTSDIPPILEAEGSTEIPPEDSAEMPLFKTKTSSSANPWAELLESGLSFLQKLASATDGKVVPQEKDGKPAAAGLSLIRRDAKTGEPYLHVPVPKKEVLEQFLSMAGKLLQQLKS